MAYDMRSDGQKRKQEQQYFKEAELNVFKFLSYI